MGKTLKIAGALLLICVLTFTAATGYFIAASDDVTVFRKTLYGDPKAAEGLKIDFRVQYKNTLHWDIHCDPVTGESDTDFIFSHNDPFYVPYDHGPMGVMMYALMDHRSHRFSWDPLPGTPEDSELFKLTEYLESLPLPEYEQDGHSTVAQEEICHTIDLSDFFEYYRFEGDVDLDGVGYVPFWDVDSAYSGTASEGSQLLTKLFNGYFKIPVRDNATVQISVYEYRNGQREYHFDGFPEDSTFFCPEIFSFVAGSSCYFAFSNTMGHDVSRIPGGWGIYRLDYTRTGNQDIATAQLSTAYSLDAATYVQGMKLSADGRRILLTNTREDGVYLTVIDLATMEQLKEIQLYSGTEAPYIHVDIHDDFILTSCGSRLCVYQLLTDGTYEQRIDVDNDFVDQPQFLNRYADFVAFDGQRLAIVDILMRYEMEGDTPYAYETCGFALQIFDSTGLLYHGEYGTSLEPIDRNSFRYGNFNYANYNAPFLLEWE